jgi:hypothetical protein
VQYKSPIKKKKQHAEKEWKIILRAEEEPFSISRTRKPPSTAVLSTELWQSHLCQILNRNDNNHVRISKNNYEYKDQPFTKDDELRAINSVKNKKAAGPHKIYNENLRAIADLVI